ncbi:phosphotransferase [Kordia algicida OT-1]|uniref:Aminoglycoside phosphotransferase n=1 Tax=Kordia algicida OT-1 TaxID=391587 RepID=A9DKC6_9FLAO|nr:phosphotransferase [Kordia algicida]EDP98299.1 aminoglycoside phosphotransferase [Kordia algicida OT-1]
MRLTKKNITHYLLDKGFLEPTSFMSGDYMLTQIQSRNSIFKIQQQQEKGLFVKQLITQDATNSYLMQKDATSHYLIHQSDLYKETATHIPDYYGYDPYHNILVTEYFANTKNVHEITYKNKKLSKSLAVKMAHILASFHFDITENIKENSSLQFFSKQIPWILNTGQLLNSNPKGITNSVIAEIYKHQDLVKKIEKVASQWETTSLIHGDIKWMNFIVMPNNEDVKLVDWEIADLGDPLWDVAGVFQSYFSAWVLSFNSQNIQQHQQMQGTEFLTIEAITSVVKVLWDTYASTQKFTASQSKEKLIKTLSYMSVRMVQTAFENNMAQKQINSNSVRILQFCNHILGNVEGIAKQWNLID